ncbi:branched-chain amino acid ABC transporter permease [Plantactinospora sp. WMMC1484]|uniref:branched-chain amino acid ABC transporter permease n=1 Tax=Plantactinospora sp. WMMC1484 TaxID=3404122 RepID=UPI003BF5C020
MNVQRRPPTGRRPTAATRWRPATANRGLPTAATRWLPAVVAAVTLALPPLLSGSHLAIYILLGLAAMVTIGLTMLMGYAGQVSLGQAAFYAIGGYTAGLLAVQGLPPLVGLLAAPLTAAAFALVVGVPLLRLRGHHLAFATLATQLILLSLLSQADWAGGAIGLQGIPRLSVGGAEFADDISYAYLVWIAVAVTLLVARNVVASRPGRGLRALATSETAAAASGIPVGRYRLTVFALSAAFAGLAGGIYAFYLGYIAPGSFPVLLSIEYVVMAVVGGLGTLWGALVGATAIILLVQVLTTLGTQPGMPSYAPSVLSYAVYALLLVLVVLFLPHGIVPAVRDRLAPTGGVGGAGAESSAVRGGAQTGSTPGSCRGSGESAGGAVQRE